MREALDPQRLPCCDCGAPVLGPELPGAGVDLERWLEGLRCSLIDQALERSGGNKAEAARLLGIERTTLVERLKARARSGLVLA